MEIIPERIRQEWGQRRNFYPSPRQPRAADLAHRRLRLPPALRQQAVQLPALVLYLSADYVATLALGNLLNKQNEALGENSTGNLAAFWGPFLLLHLGGPDTITSYSLEDNQLWLRHLLGLLLQVFTAIFVFLESLPSPHLWKAGIVVFVAGILKYGERTWSLRSASMLKKSMLFEPVIFTEKKIFNQEDVVQVPCIEFKSQNTEMKDVEIIVWGHWFFQIFMGLSANSYDNNRHLIRKQNLLRFDNSKQVFQVVEIELSLLHDTLHTKAAHVHSGKGRAMRFLSLTMAILTLVLFYRANKEYFKPGEIRITYILLIATLPIEVIAIVLLVFSDWTIVALYESGMLLSDRRRKLSCLIFKYRRLALGEFTMRRWSNSMMQYNLIRQCLRNYEWKRLKNKWFVCLRETWDGWFCTNQQTTVSDGLKDLIFNELKNKCRTSEFKATGCKQLCSSRGEWVLTEKCCTDLNWSVKKEFDERILVWHIATHLCYIVDQPRGEAAIVGQDGRKEENKNIPIISQAIGKLRKIWCAAEPPDKDVEQNLPCATNQDDKAKFLRERLEISRKISEYMMFLRQFKPSMLPAGINKIRFQDTCKHTIKVFSYKHYDISDAVAMKVKAEGLELAQERNANSIGCKDTLRAIGSKLMEIWKRKKPNLISREKMEQEKEKVVCDTLLSMEWFKEIFPGTKSQLDDACKLAQQLQDSFKERREEKWEVISAVWVEILCYAAGRCDTQVHAKQLSHGGELLSHVWLIMLNTGDF